MVYDCDIFSAFASVYVFAAFVLVVVPAGVFLEDLLSVVLEDFVESFGVGIMSSAEIDGKRARRASIFIMLEILR